MMKKRQEEIDGNENTCEFVVECLIIPLLIALCALLGY